MRWSAEGRGGIGGSDTGGIPVRRALDAAAGEADAGERAADTSGGGWRALGRARSAQVIGPFLIYLACSVILFGLRVLPRPRARYLGWGVDPSSIVWFLRWWPYAIAHGLNPFVTHVVWAPSGANLAGTTSIPGLALVASPLTLTFGAVVSYNVLYLLAPALSAWTAYLLCRHVTRSVGPSLVGGYLFGFSTYELSKMLGHLNLASVFLLPLCVLLVLLRLEGRISPLRFVVLLAAALTFQCLISTEVLFTLSLFGLIAYVVALLVLRGKRWRAMAATGAWILLSYAAAAVVLAPYLFYVLKGVSQAPIYDFYPTLYSTDLLNFVVPTTLTRMAWGAPGGISGRFSGNIGEQGAYLGIPLLAIAVLFIWRERRTFAGKFLPIVLGVVMVATLGPKLHVQGVEKWNLPWKPLAALPLARYALPGRFMVFAFLILAVIVSLWLASVRTWAWAKWTLAPAAIVLLLPNWRGAFYNSPVVVPAFFEHGVYRRYLAPGENTIVIPYGDHGHSMLWQEETGMYFRMAGGYVTVIPPKEFLDWPIIATLRGAVGDVDAEEHLKAFVGAHEVGTIVVLDTFRDLDPLFAGIDPDPVHVGGVVLYRVPASILRQYANARPPSG
jgi:hypothetical protein